jgi:hypothetical protein
LVRVHRIPPRRLRPRKRAPTDAPSLGAIQAQPRHSPLHSPTLVTSEMTAHTASGGASMTTLASHSLRIRSPSRFGSPPVAPDNF